MKTTRAIVTLMLATREQAGIVLAAQQIQRCSEKERGLGYKMARWGL